MMKTPRTVPLVDLKAGFAPIKPNIMKVIEDVLNEMHLNLGPHCHEFEREFAAYCTTEYGIGVGSGTEALQFALLACGVGRGDEVITTPHTFFATAEAIVSIGAIPVFADIDPITYTIDPQGLEKRITSKTKVVIPVHMYGQMAEMDAINNIAEKHGIAVIEDACQAHGASYRNKRAGSLSRAGCFSFYVTKNLGAYGEGGMVLTNDANIAERVRLYRNHGHRSKFDHEVFAYNGRLDEIQAAILRIKLKHLDECNEKRRSIAERYGALLKGVPIVPPREAPHRQHVYHLYVVRCEERDRLQAFLEQRGIGTGIHYRTPVHLQAAARTLGYRRGDFPETETACNEILSLPIYPELDAESQEYVVSGIREFYGL